jgi:RNA binding exosome subunit
LAKKVVAYMDVRFFAHATEDPDKVTTAVQHVLPDDYISEIAFDRHTLKGHYGNPITLSETRVKDKKVIEAFIEKLAAHLEESDKEKLRREIDRHVENGSLYLRLDKQAAVQEELALCTADPIHVRIRFKKSKLEDIIKICKELNLLKD